MSGESPFDEMKRINAPREIAVHTASKLDQLVSVGNGIIAKYHSATKGRYELEEHHKTYTAIEAELAGSELKYDVSDLQELVRAYCNQDNDSEQEAIARGLFTGALASVLTKRNREKGERTHIRINDDRNNFPYLFYFARTLDELTIDNFRGDFIAAYVASYGGTANNITLANITGDWAGGDIAFDEGRVGVVTFTNITGNMAGASIARDNGRIGTVTLANIIGYGAGGGIARSKCQVDMVTLANITGDLAGAFIASGNGRVRVVTLANITGNRAGEYIALNNGRVETVTLTNITGDDAGQNIAKDKGRVNALLAVNNKGKDYLNNNCASRTITSRNGLAKADEIQALLDELKQPDRAPEHYAQASQKLGELLRAEP